MLRSVLLRCFPDGLWLGVPPMMCMLRSTDILLRKNERFINRLFWGRLLLYPAISHHTPISYNANPRLMNPPQWIHHNWVVSTYTYQFWFTWDIMKGVSWTIKTMLATSSQTIYTLVVYASRGPLIDGWLLKKWWMPMAMLNYQIICPFHPMIVARFDMLCCYMLFWTLSAWNHQPVVGNNANS